MIKTETKQKLIHEMVLNLYWNRKFGDHIDIDIASWKTLLPL